MNLWHLIRASIYSPSFYRDLADKPLGFSLRYFYGLGLALAVVFSAVFSFRAIPFTAALVDRAGAAIVANFPDELAVTVKSGEASTNVPEPYVLPVPDDVKREAGDTVPLPKNLFVIDTSADASAMAFTEYDTVVFLTKENLLWKDDRGRITIQSLAEFPNGTVDKKFVRELADGIQGVGRWIAPAIVFGSFAFFLIIYSFLLVFCLLGALLVLITVRLRGMSVTYSAAYRMALHATTLSSLFDVVVGATLVLPPISPFSGLVFLAALFFNIRPRKNGEPRLDDPTIPEQIP